MKKTLFVLLIFILFAWFGMVAGISFLEAPLKFQAPGITRELGLGIGSLVFQVMNKVELVFFAIAFISLYFTGSLRKSWGLLVILTAIVGVQTFYLLPALDIRTELILEGQQLAETHHHLTYVITEIAKLGVLFLLGREVLLFYKKNIV